MRTNFVIITPGRTGSNHLSSLLESHGDVVCYGELFSESEFSFSKENKFNINNKKIRDRFPYIFCKYHLALNRKFKAVGFRLLLNQNKKLAVKVIKDKSIKKIFLLRRNDLKRYVSTKISKENDVWHINDPNQKIDKINKINFDFNEFFDCQYWLEQNLKQHSTLLEKTKQKYLVVFYEDLKNIDVLNEILKFINLNIKPLYSTQLKVNSEHLQEIVENYSELKSKLKDTNVGWMLS